VCVCAYVSFQHLKELTVHDTCYGPYTVQGIFNLEQLLVKTWRMHDGPHTVKWICDEITVLERNERL